MLLILNLLFSSVSKGSCPCCSTKGSERARNVFNMLSGIRLFTYNRYVQMYHNVYKANVQSPPKFASNLHAENIPRVFSLLTLRNGFVSQSVLI